MTKVPFLTAAIALFAEFNAMAVKFESTGVNDFTSEFAQSLVSQGNFNPNNTNHLVAAEYAMNKVVLKEYEVARVKTEVEKVATKKVKYELALKQELNYLQNMRGNTVIYMPNWSKIPVEFTRWALSAKGDARFFKNPVNDLNESGLFRDMDYSFGMDDDSFNREVYRDMWKNNAWMKSVQIRPNQSQVQQDYKIDWSEVNAIYNSWALNAGGGAYFSTSAFTHFVDGRVKTDGIAVRDIEFDKDKYADMWVNKAYLSSIQNRPSEAYRKTNY